MADVTLANNVLRLLDRYIYSVSELETLLFLYRFQRPWSAHQIANELRTSYAAAFDMLSTLADNGLIVRNNNEGGDQTFEYQVQSEALDQDIKDLSDAFRETKVRVIDRIYRKPAGPPSSLRQVADSFMLRKQNEQ